MKFFNFLKPKNKINILPITPEQRDFIKKHFKGTNADIKMVVEYLLPHNVHASYKNLDIYFRNENDKLIAGVSYYANKISGSPLTSFDMPADSDNEIMKIKAKSK